MLLNMRKHNLKIPSKETIMKTTRKLAEDMRRDILFSL